MGPTYAIPTCSSGEDLNVDPDASCSTGSQALFRKANFTDLLASLGQLKPSLEISLFHGFIKFHSLKSMHVAKQCVPGVSDPVLELQRQCE